MALENERFYLYIFFFAAIRVVKQTRFFAINSRHRFLSTCINIPGIKNTDSQKKFNCAQISIASYAMGI